MRDNLEKFVTENREAFDNADPAPRIYDQVKAKLSANPGRQIWKRPVFQAAAVLVMILLAAVIYRVVEKPSQETLPEEIVYDETVIGDPVYTKQIYHFRELIGLKQDELKQLEKEYPQLYQQFVGDINQLDSSYQALKLNLPENPNREILLEAMISNLQLQSELLNRQLLIIKEIKQKSKKSAHEKNTI